MNPNPSSWLMQDQKFHATFVHERCSLRHAPVYPYDNLRNRADASRKPRLEGTRK